MVLKAEMLLLLLLLPQVTLPVAKVDGLPVGLSLIGPRNSDEQLLDLAVKLADVLGLP
jgi:amidase